MATKGKDSLAIKEIKKKLNGVSSAVNEKAKKVKKAIDDNSDSIKKGVKNISEKTSKDLKKGKDFVVEKYNDIKSKITNITTKMKVDTPAKNVDDKVVLQLIKTNKELIDITKQLMNKYDKSIKLMEQINKNLSKKK